MAKKSKMQKEIEKNEKAQQAGEQMPLIDVGPENLKEIIPHARAYTAVMQRRIKALAEEVKEKCDGLLVTVTPQDDKIKVKEESGG